MNAIDTATTQNRLPDPATPSRHRHPLVERLRKPVSRLIAVAVLALALFVPQHHKNTLLEEILFENTGFVLLMLAALGRIWCAVYISGRKDRVLCTDGPYSLCRNPLYFFSFLGVTGFFLALRNFYALGITVLLFLVYYHFVIRSEERRLRALFGVAFDRYVRDTPRFIPAFRRIRSLESYTISPSIIERALKEVLWFLLAVNFIEIFDALSPAASI
jgi:protein-S-isoprenylcysteine O-methyltransferase Ste14